MKELPLTGNVSHKLNKRLERARRGNRKKAMSPIWKRHRLGFWLPNPEKSDDQEA